MGGYIQSKNIEIRASEGIGRRGIEKWTERITEPVNTRMKVGFLFHLVSRRRTYSPRLTIVLFCASPSFPGILSNVKNEAKCDVE